MLPYCVALHYITLLYLCFLLIHTLHPHVRGAWGGQFWPFVLCASKMCVSLKRRAHFGSQCGWRVSVVHIMFPVASFALQKCASRSCAVQISYRKLTGAQARLTFSTKFCCLWFSAMRNNAPRCSVILVFIKNVLVA